MTAPLTPAEALECLQDRRAVDRAELSSSAFYDRWGTFDSALWRAIDVLERLANEAKEPAAAVPSDEEITSALRRWRLHGSVDGRMECMENAILLILQRIGVKL